MDTTTHSRPEAEPYLLERDKGRHLHFLNHLATIKVAAEAGHALSVVEFVAQRGTGAPLHRHLHEDELFVVLEGELAFFSGETRMLGRTGTTAFLPRRSAHTFQVLSEEARFICITARGDGYPEFDAMVAALGTAAPSASLPEPGPIDPGRVAEICAAHGIEILGPPPPPLD